MIEDMYTVRAKDCRCEVRCTHFGGIFDCLECDEPHQIIEVDNVMTPSSLASFIGAGMCYITSVEPCPPSSGPEPFRPYK